MMYRFLANNRDELIKRCTEKVAKRPLRHATTEQLRNGVPMFLDQLTRTLEAEQDNGSAAGLKISGTLLETESLSTSRTNAAGCRRVTQRKCSHHLLNAVKTKRVWG